MLKANSGHIIKLLSKSLVLLTDDGMGASIELLRAINRNRLISYEVPISCKNASTIELKTSTQSPIRHGFGLLSAVIRLVVEERPLLTLGIPWVNFIIDWYVSMYGDVRRLCALRCHNYNIAIVSFIIMY
jgi:hypothetical protein